MEACNEQGDGLAKNVFALLTKMSPKMAQKWLLERGGRW